MSAVRRQAGFTLLELIVAAAILALIAVFSWRGLDGLLREREAIAASQDAIDALSRSFARIERDATLARDAELDDQGQLRLLAGTAVPDAPAVRYRLIDGSLVRIVGDGEERLVLMQGVATLAVEAWVPGPQGGWVRSRQAAPDPVPAPTGQPGGPKTDPQSTPPGTALPPASQPGAPVVAAPGAANAQQGPAAVAATATGVRFAIARSDGTSVVRTFLLGSGG